MQLLIRSRVLSLLELLCEGGEYLSREEYLGRGKSCRTRVNSSGRMTRKRGWWAEDQDGGWLVEKMQAYQPVVSSMLLVTGLENRFHWSFLPHSASRYEEYIRKLEREGEDNVGRKTCTRDDIGRVFEEGRWMENWIASFLFTLKLIFLLFYD